uniref:C-type lectin domain-containing protein n=1 Tax=Xiphophorus couchianus TaxID=32473 RepID=A0A3B5LFF5_9TELE
LHDDSIIAVVLHLSEGPAHFSLTSVRLIISLLSALSSRLMDPECKACQKNWILFQKKCYFFYSPHPWLTWSKSRDFCQDKHADLVVIDDQKEQVKPDTTSTLT